MLRIEQLSKSLGGRTLLHQADLMIASGEKVGLIGRNGVGKTTLFNLIQGVEEPDEGSVSLPKSCRVGLLRQELAATSRSLLEETLRGDVVLTSLREEREAVHRELAAASTSQTQQELARRLGEIEHRLEEAGHHDAESRAGKILAGLGFLREELGRSLSDFSGGYRTRLALAQLLFARPDLLLLDEPTNHLDLESVAWLTRFLARLPGTVLVISHDRSFLNAFVGVVVEMEEGRLARHTGNVEAFVAAKAAWIEARIKEARQQQQRIAEITRFIERFRAKATKARQAQSRMKTLARMTPVEAAPRTRAAPRLHLPSSPSSPREVLRFAGLEKRYGERRIFTGAAGMVARGAKIGLLGPNGAGKSTLIKLIAGRLQADGGSIRLGEGVRSAWFAQHSLEALDGERTVMEEALPPGVAPPPESEWRGVLGHFGFSGDEVFKKVAVLSGGERARLALCRLFFTRANLLLLDEPTNHLDMESRAALEEALEEWEGTLLLVSHDRDLLEAVCDAYWIVEGGGVVVWEEPLAAYLDRVLEGREEEKSGGKRSEREVKRREAEVRNALHRATSAWRARVGKLEERIGALEGERDRLDGDLADPVWYEPGRKEGLRGILERKRGIEEELGVALEEWEALSVAIQGKEEEARLAMAE